MAKGQELVRKETSLCKQVKVLFVDNFLGNFSELGLVVWSAEDLRACRHS